MILLTNFLLKLKKNYKLLFYSLIASLIIFYIHHEFVSWSSTTGNTKYITFSFLIKNILIFLIILFCLLYIAFKKKISDDGYNLVREKEIKTKAEMLTSNKRNIDTANDDAFDKVRQKEKLSLQNLMLNFGKRFKPKVRTLFLMLLL